MHAEKNAPNWPIPPSIFKFIRISHEYEIVSCKFTDWIGAEECQQFGPRGLYRSFPLPRVRRKWSLSHWNRLMGRAHRHNGRWGVSITAWMPLFCKVWQQMHIAQPKMREQLKLMDVVIGNCANCIYAIAWIKKYNLMYSLFRKIWAFFYKWLPSTYWQYIIEVSIIQMLSS